MTTIYLDVTPDISGVSPVRNGKCFTGKIEPCIIYDEGKVAYPLIRIPGPIFSENIITHACAVVFIG